MQKNELSQEQLVVLLETTAQQLNGVLERLKTASSDNLPTKSTVETLVKTTQMIATALEPSPMPQVILSNSPEEITAESDELTRSDPPKLAIGIDDEFSWFTRLKTRWSSFLKLLSLIVPFSWLNNRYNLTITTIFVSITGLILSTLVFLFLQPLTPLPESPSITSKPKVVATPPLLKSPETPQSMEMLLPSELGLTPEQNLIEAIQHDIVDLTSQYPEELISLIKVNFRASRLMITLGEQWYQLKPKRQDTLTNNIFKCSQGLNFRKLEMIDSQGNLIARSPVVGDEIVIFRR